MGLLSQAFSPVQRKDTNNITQVDIKLQVYSKHIKVSHTLAFFNYAVRLLFNEYYFCVQKDAKSCSKTRYIFYSYGLIFKLIRRTHYVLGKLALNVSH